VSVDVGDLGAPASGSPPFDLRAPSIYVPPAPVAAVEWPASVTSAAQAEDALKRALQGKADRSLPLHALALKTLETLSDLEKGVLAGEPQPVDAAPIRKSVIIRLRVADGLASVPPTGGKVDAAALSAILGEIDQLLAEVAPLLGSAPAELAPALEAIRNTLVSEAIDFSEAAARVTAAAAQAPAAPVAPKKAATARIVETYSAPEAPRGRRAWAWFWLVLVALPVGAYQVRGYLYPPKPPPVQTLPGAPEGLQLVENEGHQTLVRVPGKRIDPQQLESFRAQQAQKGIEVRELAPGLYQLVPATPAGGAK
jgi:hypothetical protein